MQREAAAPDRFWTRLAGGLSKVGASAGKAAVWVGDSVASAYRAVDPDVRRHVVQLPLLGLTLFGRRDAPLVPLPDDGFRPIVFVPGLGGHPGNFFPMRTWFRLRGRVRAYAFSPTSGDSLESEAARLGGLIEQVVSLNELGPSGRVDLVTHSLGGIVARLALEDPANAARVATLVTLGTPHAGTFLARYGNTAIARSLRPGSDLVQRLERQLPWCGPPEGPRLVAFHSAADVVLLPAGSARVEGAENVEISGCTHYGYLLHPTAWEEVLRALGT
jgi:pimeloyl-ACP methyl ester carboxylesterase